MSAPAQQSMSGLSSSEKQNVQDWLRKVVYSPQTMEAFDRHGVSMKQLVLLEDGHMEQMQLFVGEQLRLKQGLKVLKMETERKERRLAAEAAAKIVASFWGWNPCCRCCPWCVCPPNPCSSTKWQLSEAGIIERKAQGCTKGVKHNNIDFAQLVDINRESSGCCSCLGTVYLETETGESLELKTVNSKKVMDKIKTYWQMAKDK